MLRFSLPKNHLMIGTRARKGIPREDFSMLLRSKPPSSTISSFRTLTIDLKRAWRFPEGRFPARGPELGLFEFDFERDLPVGRDVGRDFDRQFASTDFHW